jgi:hypothetical protein
MKVNRRFAWGLLVVLVVSWMGVLPAAADGSSTTVGIYSVAACKDSSMVAVVGTSAYANNRIVADIYYQDGDGNMVSLKHVESAPFGTGRFSMAIPMHYVKRAVSAGTLLRVEVKLQRLSHHTYVTVATAAQHVTAADQGCFDLCSLTLDTLDRAPAGGTVALRSHYGAWFRPEGWLHGAMPVQAGQPLRVTFVGLPCDLSVRAWYYPNSGDPTPLMLPAQYWPYEYQVNEADGTNPYVTTFAGGLPATEPLEKDDPFVYK